MRNRFLKEEIKKLNTKIDTFADHVTSQQNATNQNNAKSLVINFETHYGYLRNIGKIHIQEKAYKTKKNKNLNCGEKPLKSK